jgi:hypothetical protein
MPSIKTLLVFSALCLILAFDSIGQCECDPLPPASGDMVTVGSVTDLQAAVNNADGPFTIYVENGTYDLSSEWIQIENPNLIIRSLSGNREDVIFEGGGMDGVFNHAFQINATGITIADLTIRNVSIHPISVSPWNTPQDLHFLNLHIVNAGEQFIKVSYGDIGGSSGVVECCLLEYETTLDEGNYTNGIDIHGGVNWVIRNNTIKNIKAAPGAGLAGPAILIWTASEGTVVENNTIIDCDMGIFFGNSSHDFLDHTGGIIRNNVIVGYEDSDAAIGLVNTQGALVENNSIYSPNDDIWSIEVRFEISFDNTIVNNLCTQWIQLRDGGQADIFSNVEDVVPGTWLDPQNQDLHLSPFSDAINAGTDDNGTTFPAREHDMDCHELSDGLIDIGADEYNSTPTEIEREKLSQSIAIVQLGNVFSFGAMNVDVQVFDLLGKKLFEAKQLSIIDLSFLESKLILIRVTKDSAQVTRRFVVN